MSRRRTRTLWVFAVGGVGFLSAACGGGDSEPLPPIDESYAPAVLQLGGEVYGDTCSVCHGRRGEGGIGPALVRIAENMTYDAHLAVVMDGAGEMPAFSGTLTVEEIEAVVAYERVGLRSLGQ